MKYAFCIVVLTLAAIPCQARTITVDDDNPADFNNIQAAINDANNGDTVEIQPGTYTGPGNRDIDFLGKPITVTGIDPDDANTVAETIIDCNAAEADRHRGFNFVSGEGRDSVLAGVTITNGNGPYAEFIILDRDILPYLVAGAIFCNQSSPTIMHCNIKGNYAAEMGGAMFNCESSPEILDCSFIENGAEAGGAIWNWNSSPSIKNCVFHNHSTFGGGGAAVYWGRSAANPIIANCTFTANSSAARSAGAILNRAESGLIIANCTFMHNSAGERAGAIYNYEASPLVSNCIIVENSAGQNGGAIYNDSGIHGGHADPTIVNCTFSNNSAGLEGGGIYNHPGHQSTDPANPTLVNCILWNNTDKRGAVQSSQIYVPDDGEPSISFSCIQGWTGTLPGVGNIDADPGFVHPLTYDYHILPDSPCIDAGDPDHVPSSQETDIDNEPRIMGARVDIGADEFKEGTEPLIGISPNEFYIGVSSGDTNPQIRTLSIQNLGNGILHWTINKDSPWLDVSPQSGEAEDDVDDVTLTVEGLGISLGLYVAELVISADGAANSPLSIPVLLHILDDDGQLHVPSEYATIQTAIDAARAGEAVVIAPGRHTGPGNRDLDLQGKAITVRSSDPCDPTVVEATVIDCQGTEADAHRAFVFNSQEGPDSIVAGLTIENGYGPDAPILGFNSAGGAFFCLGSSPTITGCRIMNNYAEHQGGGMYFEDSNPTITNCLFSHNIAQSAGGIYNRHSDSLIEDCTFLGNSTQGDYCYGGAIANMVASSPTIRRCSFIENHSFGSAGAIHNYGSGTRPTIHNCIFRKNEAAYGAGMYNDGSNQTTVTNCTFNQNVARHGGGAICHSDGETTVTNCILWDNSPTETCDPWGKRITYSNVQGGAPGQGNIDMDPCFADVDSGDYHLSAGSPCIDSGDPDYIPAAGETDMDGEPRVMGGRVDMGIDELPAALIPILRISPVDFSFSACQDGPNPQPQTLYIRNAGSGEMHWQYVHDCEWIDLSPTSGVLSLGEVEEVAVTADVSALLVGRYDCAFTVTADEALNTPQTAAATLVLGGLNLHVPAEFPTIQAAIDSAVDWDTVIVADGTYTGPGNRDIDFEGKAITVRSENGPAKCIIDCNASEGDEHVGFYFDSAEGPYSIVSGFTITNVYSHSYCPPRPPFICFYPAGAIHCERYSNASPTIRNCIITGGLGPDSYGLFVGYKGGSPTLINCTITGQKAGGIYCDGDSGAILRNCILRDNALIEISGWTDSVTAEYCNVEGAWPGPGNIDTDPCFVDPGFWDPNGTPEDANDDFWVHGRGDYHLKSQAGRYDPNTETWVIDEVTSPCIDAGEPLDPIGPEPFPNGGIINMGAHGGTAEAGKSYFNQPPCETIMAGDINGDCQINFEDLRLMTLHWCEENN